MVIAISSLGAKTSLQKFFAPGGKGLALIAIDSCSS
jgi:hypothetical protein